MALAISQSYVGFEDLLKNAKDLVEIHNRLGGRPGRRFGEMSLNRAVVILTVAAWQAYVEDLARAALGILAPTPQTLLYQLIRADTLNAIRRFNTPNSRNTIDLLIRTGFDPSVLWAFLTRWPWARLTTGEIFYQQKTWTSAQAIEELDIWLQVRHRIAHGRDLDDPGIRRILSGTASGKPSLRKVDAERCIAFMEALAKATDKAANLAFP